MRACGRREALGLQGRRPGLLRADEALQQAAAQAAWPCCRGAVNHRPQLPAHTPPGLCPGAPGPASLGQMMAAMARRAPWPAGSVRQALSHARRLKPGVAAHLGSPHSSTPGLDR